MLRTKRRLKSRHYQYNKLHDIDKSIKNLSVNQIIIIISIGFLLLFGFLALYLPQQAVQRPFIQMSNDNNTNINAKNNIDKEGHIQIFYYPWVCLFVCLLFVLMNKIK